MCLKVSSKLLDDRAWEIPFLLEILSFGFLRGCYKEDKKSQVIIARLAGCWENVLMVGIVMHWNRESLGNLQFCRS